MTYAPINLISIVVKILIRYNPDAFGKNNHYRRISRITILSCHRILYQQRVGYFYQIIIINDINDLLKTGIRNLTG
jgi:hypothetical protein